VKKVTKINRLEIEDITKDNEEYEYEEEEEED